MSSLLHKIYQLASFSRSGETLLLRCLNAHPDIEVVHQINEPDSEKDLSLFRKIRFNSNVHEISGDDPDVSHRNLGPSSVLLVKNAVWSDYTVRRGFILARNPFSVVMSAYRHQSPNAQSLAHQIRQQLRWSTGIDDRISLFIKDSSPLDGFLTLYTRKMLHDYNSGLPYIRYEDFVVNPEPTLRSITDYLGLKWSDSVLNSHTLYNQGVYGHGKIKLWQPIHPGSLDKYKTLSSTILSKIYSFTWYALECYGYQWNGSELTLRYDDSRLLT